MSVYRIENNYLRGVKIEKVVKESSLVKTFFFNDKLCAQAKPGQFIMVWLPGFDEIPMSISSTSSNGSASITAANVGEATDLLHKKGQGDIIGVRGPFGSSFNPVKGNVLLVGGGTGIAPLALLAKRLVKLGTKVTFLVGAKTSQELLFLAKLERLFLKAGAKKIFASTEDGSYGHKGVLTELVEETLATEKFDAIYACGKEPMLCKVFMLAEKHETPLQASLERFMRCAIGLCGSCIIGKYRVCVDGPVFVTEQLREIKDEFGRFKRGFDGRKKPI